MKTVRFSPVGTTVRPVTGIVGALATARIAPCAASLPCP